MRLEFEPKVKAIPFFENEEFSEVAFSRIPDTEALLKSGIAAAQRGEREAARCLLNEVADNDPHCEDAWMWLASISEYPEELLVCLQHVLEINPENDRASTWLASTQALLAKSSVQKAIAANEDGSADRAIWYLEQALELDEQCELAWFWKASLAATEQEKLAHMERVIAINPENEEALDAVAKLNGEATAKIFDAAKAAAIAGKRANALKFVDEFLSSVPDNAEAWVLRSHLVLGLDEKLDSLQKALAIDPNNAAARANCDFLSTTLGKKVEVDEIESESTAEELFAPEVTPIEAEAAAYDDVSRLEGIAEVDDIVAETEDDPVFGSEYQSVDVEAETLEDVAVVYEPQGVEVYEESEEPFIEPHISAARCPFCDAGNETQAFACTSCNAVLTLSDIESLLSNPNADHDKIGQAAAQMEAEWNFREFSAEELTYLGIAHLNLRHFEPGLRYLQEASRVDPNNVILAGHVNAIAIRIDEFRRQEEVHGSLPEGKTILVVDDSPTVRKLISGKLEKAGHTVLCACDGVEALEQMAESMPDLVLLDIAMPRMDGYEVCKQIRANPAAQHLPVVMISGKDGFFDKVRGRLAGTTGYVTKPFGPETLMKALDTYLLPEQETI